MNIRPWILPAVLVLLCSFAARAEAGQEPQKPPSQGPRKTTFTLSTDDSWRFDSDLDKADTSVSVASYKLSAEMMHLEGSDIFRASAAGEFWEYEFDKPDNFIPGWPDELEVHAYRFDPAYMHAFDAHWTGLGYGTVSFAWQEGERVSQSLSGAVGTGVLYRFDENLTIGGAFHVQFRIAENPWVYPLFILDWKINPDMTLKTEQKAGYGFTYDWTLDEARTLTFEARLRYLMRRFRLNTHNVVEEGVMQDQRFALDVGIRWEPVPGLKLGLYLGSDLWQEFKVEDKHGNDILEDSVPFQSFLGLNASYSF